ncbi:MAG: nicotinate phosphoribosyltransferase [Elusimicrobia bacterium]|nr:nicotinate phosphoribosyltransferase [Elusimicrobiota bacterium]
MAYGYWKSGMLAHRATFNLHFRRPPFDGGYTLACGQGLVAEFLEAFRYQAEDLAYLAGLETGKGGPLFEEAFLRYLEGLRLSCDVHAVPEGTVVFPHEPLLRVEGPLLEAQLLETALLTLMNFQSLVATKAARMTLAARGAPVLEFGLRRAQGIDGALAASRAAYLGGCSGTSNVLAGKLFGIPVKGTQAHSWILSFDDEREAFLAFARALPDQTVLLVDTFDTLEGVRRAVAAGRWLQERGHRLAGVRLDSGDLAYLSREARRLLDEAGFQDAAIVASNELDEHLIESLRGQGAAVTAWAVGTRLVTAHDDPALGGVYKLSAVQRPGGAWEPRVKLSEQAVKTSTPGRLQIRRYHEAGRPAADMIYDLDRPPGKEPLIVDPLDSTRRRKLDGKDAVELLEPLLEGGRLARPPEPLAEARRRVQVQLASFHEGVKRLANPHRFLVGLEKGLYELRTRLILEARGLKGGALT